MPPPGGEADPRAPWLPLEPGDITGLFDALAMPWWIAGGWALDLALGRQTRSHGDLDIAIARGSQPRLLALGMAGWECFVAHEGTLRPWDGSSLVAPYHQFWVREPGGPRWAFEVLLEEIEDDEWRYRGDPSIRRPVAEIGARTLDGIPYLVPELTLLYQANRPDDQRAAADFEVVLPELSEPSRAWLRTALATVQPGHPWLARL